MNNVAVVVVVDESPLKNSSITIKNGLKNDSDKENNVDENVVDE